MTREEIMQLNTDYLNGCESEHKMNKLFSYILSQQPCEDAVSRDAPRYWMDKDNKIYKMPDDIPTMTIQYPTITHGDTISRTEVMNVLSDFITLEKYIDKHNCITFEPLEQMINALPPVTQKSGEWIYEEVTRYEEDGDTVRSYVDKKCKCSACGHDYGYQRIKDPFCRYCGARMVEPQESEG